MNSKIFLLALISCLIQTVTLRELKFIEVVSRHGVRYPSYPNAYDNSNITIIRNAKNQLTIQGKSMHYLLGKRLYQKYWKQLFANTPYQSKFHRQLIYAKSTNTNRTIESLQSQLFGLLQDLQIINQIKPNKYYFPPFSFTKEDQSNLTENEQNKLKSLFTFPIHVEKGAQGDSKIANLQFEGDFLVKEQTNLCPNQPLWLEQNYNSLDILQLSEHKVLKPAFQMLNRIYHRNNISIKDAYQYIDNFVCLKSMGEKYLQQFQIPELHEPLQFLYVSRLYIDYLYTEQQKRTFSTRLIANTIQNMKKSIEEKSPKIVLYTAHDVTIAILLSSMNFTNFQCIAERYLQGKNIQRCYDKYPPFASTFIFELWEEDNKDLTISISIDGVPYQIPICNYTYSCSIKEFQKWFDTHHVDSPNQQCGVPSILTFNLTFRLQMLITFIIGLIIPLIYQKWRRSKVTPPKVQNDDSQVFNLVS